MSRTDYYRQYRETHREEISEKRRAARQTHPERVQQEQERSARWRQAHPDAMAANGQKWNETNRKAVFDHYGWSCACCGTAEDLSIDHVTPREGPKRVGSALYRWLIANGFPDGFQTLCRPCNRSKARGERCRIKHKLRTRVLAEANGHAPQDTQREEVTSE